MKLFEDTEILLIKESFEFRKKNSDIQSNNILDKIESKLHLPVTCLSGLQRGIITGCVKEFIIYPNQDILNKSDYEIFLSRKEIEQDCLRIDLALKILNKIKKRTESKRTLFEQTFEKIDKLSNSKQAYYSLTKEGYIYHVGIVTGYKEGMTIVFIQDQILSNFEIGYLSQYSFLRSGSPIEVFNNLKEYKKENILTENHKLFF